jgi:tetratricopeptide (TPR) repeat protein
MYRHVVLSVLLWVLVPALLWAQERWLRGEVIHIGGNGEELPEVNITVIMKQTGDRDTTDSRGRFRVFLPKVFKAGEKVTLDVEEPGWRIQYPLEGEVRVPADLLKEVVEVRLLPVGSIVFLTPAHIEKFIQDVAEKAKQQVTPEGKPEQLDLSRYVKEWAVKYGFSVQEVKAEIDAWIAEVEKNQNDLYTLGLAAFARKNFGGASKLFNDSAEYKANKLAELKQREQHLTAEVVRDFRLAGDAHGNDNRPNQALQAYQRAMQYVVKEQTPQLWAALWRDIGLANWGLARQEKGPAMQQSLREAEQALRRALEVYTRKYLPQAWATTQIQLGAILSELSANMRGEESVRLSQEALAIHRRALEVISRLEQPQVWAAAQAVLGLKLSGQALLFSGEDRARMFAEAAMAFQQALEAFTREQNPKLWVHVQSSLAQALVWQSETAKGQEKTHLLESAAAAYRRASERLTREEQSYHWAWLQFQLGFNSMQLAHKTSGEDRFVGSMRH